MDIESSIKNNIDNVRGIFQVGANTGQEMPLFLKYTANIILVEPIASLVNMLKANYPKITIIPYALGSKTETKKIYQSTNNFESSSLLKPLKHCTLYPSVKFDDGIEIQVKTFSDVKQEFNIDISTFNVLVTDTQGYDLEVIKGFDNDIVNFELIILEYINSELYEGNSNLEEIKKYLTNYKFSLLYTFDETQGAGNAVFKRQ